MPYSVGAPLIEVSTLDGERDNKLPLLLHILVVGINFRVKNSQISQFLIQLCKSFYLQALWGGKIRAPAHQKGT